MRTGSSLCKVKRTRTSTHSLTLTLMVKLWVMWSYSPEALMFNSLKKLQNTLMINPIKAFNKLLKTLMLDPVKTWNQLLKPLMLEFIKVLNKHLKFFRLKPIKKSLNFLKTLLNPLKDQRSTNQRREEI